MRRPALISTLLLVAVTSVACGAGTISQEELEQQVVEQLTQTVGQEPDAVDCPGDLEAEVGAEATCVLSAGEDTIDVAVRVTEVEGDTASFDIQVADEVN